MSSQITFTVSLSVEQGRRLMMDCGSTRAWSIVWTLPNLTFTLGSLTKRTLGRGYGAAGRSLDARDARCIHHVCLQLQAMFTLTDLAVTLSTTQQAISSLVFPSTSLTPSTPVISQSTLSFVWAQAFRDYSSWLLQQLAGFRYGERGGAEARAKARFLLQAFSARVAFEPEYILTQVTPD